MCTDAQTKGQLSLVDSLLVSNFEENTLSPPPQFISCHPNSTINPAFPRNITLACMEHDNASKTKLSNISLDVLLLLQQISARTV